MDRQASFRDQLQTLRAGVYEEGGLLDRLTHQAYQNVRCECVSAAIDGKDHIVTRLEFERYLSDYKHMEAEILPRVAEWLREEDLEVQEITSNELKVWGW